MRLTPRRLLKAAAPYGLLVAYRRAKPRYQSFAEKRRKRSAMKEEFFSLLREAKKLKGAKKPKTIVSITSYGARLHEVAPLAIVSLFRQSVLPDKIILWIADGEKTPHIFDSLKELGLEIRFCEDTKSYKKLIPALELYPECTIITVDDDVVYPEDWLKRMIAEHKKWPSHILAHTAREITANEKNGFAPYWTWPILDKNIKNSHRVLPNGIGGVLYPPDSFADEVLDKELFTRLAPYGDDLWFWAMSELKGTKRKLIDNGYYNIREFDRTEVGLWNTVNSDEKTGNDSQLTNIFDAFPQLVKKVGLSSSEIGMTGLRFEPAKMQTPEEQVLFSKHQFAYNYARDIAKEMGAGSVLDYGCGDGYGADFLAEMLPGLKITATDIDKTALAGARIKYKRKNLQFVEMIDVKTYDLIVSYQVIEHVENVEEYLRDLRGMLKKDGKIIISTPDRVYRLTENQAPWNSFHLREYTREALEQDVQKVFPLGRVLRLTGEDNMLRIEYNRVAGNRADGAIYGGKLPKKTNRVYKPEDFYLTESDDKGSLDLFAVIENEFKGSKDYWEQRYVEGGNSGAGSYGNLAEFKAKIINKFVKKNKVSTVIELGVGDGNQLLLMEYPNFIGFDVSKTAVKMCREMFKSDKSKEFYTLDKLKGHTAELTLSLDVLYHLVEKDVFEQHIRSLFEASTRYVIIYAFDGQEFHTASHVQSRRFTDFIENNIKSWKLTKRIKNKYPHDDNNPDHTSRADFYIYERTA